MWLVWPQCPNSVARTRPEVVLGNLPEPRVAGQPLARRSACSGRSAACRGAGCVHPARRGRLGRTHRAAYRETRPGPHLQARPARPGATDQPPARSDGAATSRTLIGRHGRQRWGSRQARRSSDRSTGATLARASLCPHLPTTAPPTRRDVVHMWCKAPDVTMAPTIYPSQSHIREVRERGVEPPRPFGHTDLNRARLPFRHSRPAPWGASRKRVAQEHLQLRFAVRSRPLVPGELTPDSSLNDHPRPSRRLKVRRWIVLTAPTAWRGGADGGL